MKKQFIPLSLTALILLPLTAAQAIELKDNVSRASYGIGVNIANNLKSQGLDDISIEALIEGIKDASSGAPLKLTEEEINQAFMSLQEQEMKRQSKVAEENLSKGAAYLEKNAKEAGVKTTTSGLQYKIIKEGKGPKPKATDTVVTQYRGKLIDGTEFDSSYSRNQPAEFQVNKVIPGWTEALQMMPVGSTWEIYVPAKLAYGDFSPTPLIPANSTLVFDVELVKIK
jgi:FKBP-type peptidyl-prolyl cis-trans isomerase FklB